MNIPNPSHPYTGLHHIVVTDRVDTKVIEAMDAMSALGLPIGELMSAIIHGMTPSSYVRARSLGHSHQEILDEPSYVHTTYLHLRENYGCTADEALEVYKLTPDGNKLYGKQKRDLYRVVLSEGGSHRKALQAMQLVEPCLSTTFYVLDSDLGAYRLESLTRLLRKALAKEPDSSINDIWRAWLRRNNQKPYDIEEIADAA